MLMQCLDCKVTVLRYSAGGNELSIAKLMVSDCRKLGLPENI